MKREMARPEVKLGRGAAKSMSSKDWIQQALTIAQIGRISKRIRKKRASKVVKSSAQMAGATLTAAQTIDAKVTREDLRMARRKLLAKQRANYVQTQIQNAAQKMQNASARLGLEKVRPQRLQANVTQTSARLRSNAVALQTKARAGVANLKFREAKLQRKRQNYGRNLQFNAYELRQNATKFRNGILQQQQEQKINTAIAKSNILENRQDLLANRSNYTQSKRFGAQAGKLTARVQAANARNARNWSQSAMKTEPARQMAELLGGPNPRRSEVLQAAMRPQLNAPSALNYRVPNVWNGPPSRNFQVT